jgi:glycosyltransferase involved in cell wall biosynthesis
MPPGPEPDARSSISVIVPVYNGERFLPEAIASIRGQGDLPLEIIVVDDGSTDGSAALAHALDSGIRYQRRERGGPAAARNSGIVAARGGLIAFLDVDDLWPPDKLSVQLAYLAAHPDVDVVLGRVRCLERVDPGGWVDVAGGEAVVGVNLGCGLFRRRVFDRVGLFDESLTYSEDHDWFFRAREERVAIAVLDQVGLYYRRHEGNMTGERAARGYQLAQVVRRSLERRRRRAGGADVPLPRLSDFRSIELPDGEGG